MSALLLMLAISALVGVVAWMVVRRWPQADPAASVAQAARESPRPRGRIGRFLRSRFDPAVTTGLALTAASTGLVVAGVIIGVFVFMVRSSSGVVTIDERIATWVSGEVHGLPLLVTRWITQLGSTPVIVLLAVGGAVYGVWRWRRPSILLFLTIVVAGQSLLMNLIKLLVDRARPAIHPHGTFSGPSFPSGHATGAAATFAALALVLTLRRSPRARAALFGVAVSVAVAVAGSRVLLGAHWFSDVIAGLVLGWSWFGVSAVAFGGRMVRFGEPVEAAGTGGSRRMDMNSSSPVRGSRVGAAGPGLETPREVNSSSMVHESVFDERGGAAAGIAARLRRWPPPAIAAATAILGYLVVGILLVGIGLILTKLLSPGPIPAWDNGVDRWFAARRTAGWSTVTDYASLLAQTPTVLVVAGVAGVILAIRRLWRELGFLVVAFFIEFGVFLTTVMVVERPRPSVPKLDHVPATSSFPSGHQAASIVLYAGLALVISSRTRSTLLRVAVWTIAVIFVVAVGVSRVYRGLHHPIDVFAGVVLGIGALLFAILAMRAADAASRRRAERSSHVATLPPRRAVA
jgi:undecaprenyl-diphosphatase